MPAPAGILVPEEFFFSLPDRKNSGEKINGLEIE
jgi:hypothetical protein